MQLEMTNTICPLCRRAACSDDHQSAVTRLCIDCRALIHTLVPGGNLSVAASVAGRADFAPQRYEPPHVDDPVFFDNAIEAEGDLQPQEDHQPVLLDQGPDYTDEHAPDAPDDEQAYQSFDTAPQEAINTGPLEDVFVYDEQTPEPQVFDEAGQTQNYYHAAEAYGVAPAMEKAAAPAENPADPWDDPLPAWDYSRTEWPIVVNQDGPGIWARLRKPSIIVLVLVAIISLYYFAFRPQAEGDRDQAVPVSNDAAAAASKEKAAAASPAESSPSPTQTATGTGAVQNQAPVTQAVSSAEDIQAEGNFTLQVAAIPDEASAIAYSERLTRAGISTYIVPVENGRRKFFRVRVGRFKTAEDAQRYAAQSRLRGRAAGLSLDFMVVAYVNP